ncbi:Protein C19orf12 [Amphibalanus amphitrite]|uniref:Protein C19orf12 n=1 Tax=Amphibalanus amphitrite TaxID=1232801 RepID=A0A6A4VN35_AMPAM|nr:Protein C19orf12 [Amphibalanus amphitrite]
MSAVSMPLDRHDVMALLAQLAEEEEMRVTVKGSAQGALLAGAGAFFGGLLMGPVGLLIGSTAGGGAGYALSAGQFRSAGEVIRQLPPDRQCQLERRVNHLVSRLNAQDVLTAVTMLAIGGGAEIRSLIIAQVVNFLTNEMAMEVSGVPGQTW